MSNDDERDLAEERYWREFCIPCGTSPCGWDGTPDGFHAGDPPDPDWERLAEAELTHDKALGNAAWVRMRLRESDPGFAAVLEQAAELAMRENA